MELWRLDGPDRLQGSDRLLPYRLLPHRLLPRRLLWRRWKLDRTAGLEDCSLSTGMEILNRLLAAPLPVELSRRARSRFAGMRTVTRSAGLVAFRAPTEKARPARIRLRQESAVSWFVLL